MGEAKRREQLRSVVEGLTKRLTDDGMIIEAGWMALKVMTLPDDASQIQIDEMRNAFFAGAQHLFSSIMSILDPGEEPTEKELERLDLIDRELKGFIEAYKLKHFQAEGTA